LENLWGDADIWVADTWSQLNDQCFSGNLRYCGVVWATRKRVAGHGPLGRITLHPALLDPKPWANRFGKIWTYSVEKLGSAYAADTLVHEMAHAWLLQLGEADHEDHNSQAWCDEIVRLTPLLGLAAVKAERVVGQPRDGFLSKSPLRSWPHEGLRSPGYYTAKGRLPVRF
jgi:hypothetical protein